LATAARTGQEQQADRRTEWPAKRFSAAPDGGKLLVAEHPVPARFASRLWQIGRRAGFTI
jgi:hypothetical protein